MGNENKYNMNTYETIGSPKLLSTSCSEPLSSDDGVRNLCCLTSSVNEKEFIDFSRKNVKLNERSACSLESTV